MSFKHHQCGDQSKRPPEEELEAQFHQALVMALDKCTLKGNKKKQGYIMGAFREVLANFTVEIKS